ncbi:hypothetical protein SOVF_160490, partial [Spinacia oleracea]
YSQPSPVEFAAIQDKNFAIFNSQSYLLNPPRTDLEFQKIKISETSSSDPFYTNLRRNLHSHASFYTNLIADASSSLIRSFAGKVSCSAGKVSSARKTTRYYAHISFLLNVPESSDEGSEEFIEYVSQQLNRGCLFWSLGLRAFYFAFPVLLWIFGAIAMFACSCSMAILLYFLDTASSSPSYLYNGNVVKTNRSPDIESRRVH